MIKIDKNIPLPDRGSSKYPVRDMEVGDSFFVKCEDSDFKRESNTARTNCIRVGKPLGFKFSIRRWPGGFRCWRTK